jgi:DNA-binding LytR/AlgR family response regulator
MLLTCVTIDDEPLALEVLKQYISHHSSLELIGSFDDAIEGQAFLQSTHTDILFIDINMPDIKGTDLVRSLQNPPLVIFTTAYKDYALEGFELNAIDYLVKPIERERFDKAVGKALDFWKARRVMESETGSLFVRSEYQLVKIDFKNIEYIESVEDYIKIHVTGGKPIMTLMTMKTVMEKLPSSSFLRIHRSYIVPANKIKSVVNRKVSLPTVELPVSSSYIDSLKKWTKQ